MSELKPCPFCGQAPEIVPHGGLKFGAVVIRCGNEECPVYAYTIAAPLDDAAKAWNTRAERTCKMEREPNSDRLWWCSSCESYHEHASSYPWEFCPRCGAKVVEP